MSHTPAKSQFLIYQAANGVIKIDVRFEDETVWLTQQLMAELFQTTKQNIGQHLRNIFEEGELAQAEVVKNFFTTAADGKNYSTNFYNDVTIAKNYLSEGELAALNNLVEQYLVFAEGQAMRRMPMRMRDWIAKLDGFLSLNERDILTHAGQISHELTVQRAEQEYDTFHQQRAADEAKRPDDFEKSLTSLPAPTPGTGKERGAS
jgi:hypothetical protein